MFCVILKLSVLFLAVRSSNFVKCVDVKGGCPADAIANLVGSSEHLNHAKLLTRHKSNSVVEDRCPSGWCMCNETFRLVCGRGASLVGPRHVKCECREKATWTTFPDCRACHKNQQQGSVDVRLFKYPLRYCDSQHCECGTKVKILCDSNLHQLLGSPELTCNCVNETWNYNGTEPRCVEINAKLKFNTDGAYINETKNTKLIVALSIGIPVGIFLLAICIYFSSKSLRKTHLSENNWMNALPLLCTDKHKATAGTFSERLFLEDNLFKTTGKVKYQKKMSVTKHCKTPEQDIFKNIEFVEHLGNGTYGTVYRATADVKNGKRNSTKEITVAVKHAIDPECVIGLLSLQQEHEAYEKVPLHKNVVKYLGFSDDLENGKMIINEYLPFNLKTFLEATSVSLQEKTSVPKQLIRFALEIAEGMGHITSHSCLHRDPAARNVLLNLALSCKVTNFGLREHVVHWRSSKQRTDSVIPVRWMALESLEENVFTVQSDVWAFGVIMWEILTLGKIPYPSLQKRSAVAEAVSAGHRLEKPFYCPGSIYSIMTSCWRTNPNRRPTFDNLCEKIKIVLDDESDYLTLISESINELTDG